MPHLQPRSSAQIALGLVLLVGGKLAAAPPHHEQVSNAEVIELVAKLGADSYETRSKSARRLTEIAHSGGSVSAQQIADLLRDNPFPPDDLEVYLSKKRLLQQVEAAVRERQLDRLLHDPSFDRSSVAGWDQFRAHAGEGLDARLVFTAAVRADPEIGQRLSEARYRSQQLPDFDKIRRQDTATWSITLCAVCQRQGQVSSEDLMRLTASLRGAGTGPEPMRDHERRVISRLVGDCLSSVPMDLRDRMVIALRYQCSQILSSDWRLVLGDPSQSPSRVVIAMLAASAVNPVSSEVDEFIDYFLKDERVSHVSRSLLHPKTTHRTQVRDVALALKLHRSGRDPREQGFSALEADPVLVFRPYSLGFESDQTRCQAHTDSLR